MTFYRLLGPVGASHEGRPVELGSPKQRKVLAVLLLEAGRVVSTDRLGQAVWGDDQPPSVVGSLQVHISNLRRILRDDTRATSPIVRQPPGYVINVEPQDLDIALFRAACDQAQAAIDAGDWAGGVAAAQEALGLWQGPLLAEYEDEDWVRISASAALERRAACQQHLVAGLLGTGQVTSALNRASRLHSEEPLSERACWLHMIALYRAGRTADALETFRAHVKQLDDDLGLGAGPALRDLQGAMLRQEPHLDFWPATAPLATTPGVVEPDSVSRAHPAAARVEDTSSDIVGRVRELAVIDQVLQESRLDGSRWVVLTGVAGIGKSRLAEEAVAQWKRSGGRVSRTRCPEDDVPSWWPIRQLVHDLGAEPDDILVPPSGADADASRYEVYERVLGLLGDAVRTQPLLLFVDDVHWADPTSLRFLTYLAEAQQQPGLCIVVTAREAEGGEPVARLLASVARREGCRQLSIPPLSTAEVIALAGHVSGQRFEPQEAAQLALRTGGNPFFVSEYARLPEEERRSGEVPLAVRSVLGRRLAGLDPDALAVLRTAALIGEELDIELLAAVARLDRDELADLLDDAADERIIVPSQGSGSYMFAHALLRDEVMAGLSDMRRRRGHLRIADAIGTGGGSDRLVRRAAHLMAALPLADAADAYQACRAAALDAEDRWQSEAAARWWESALTAYDLLPESSQDERDELVIARVAALARAGRGQTVLDAVDAALLDAVRRGRFSSAGRLAASLLRSSGAWPWAAHGSDPGPLQARLAGVESLVRDDPAAHARILTALAVGSCYDPDGQAPDALSARALELAEQLGDPDVLADALLGRALAFSAIAERAVESVLLLERLAALPHRLAQLDDVLRHSLLSLAQFSLGEPDLAAEHVRLGAVGSDLLRLPVSRVQLRWMEGTISTWRGDYDRAREVYAQALENHRRTELYESGVHDMATLSLDWQRNAVSGANTADPAHAPWAAAVVAVARNDPQADALIAAEIARPEPAMWTTLGRFTLLAHAAADRGLVEHVLVLRRRLEPFAGFIAGIGQVGVVGPVSLALARLSLLAGDIPEAQSYLDAAFELAARANGKGALARCQDFAAELEQHRTG